MPPGWSDDEWRDEHWRNEHWRHVRPPFPPRESQRGRTANDRLFAGEWKGDGLHRSRSQGHNPVPNVYIWNNMDQEANPQMAQDPRMQQDAPPRGRPHHLGDFLEEDLHHHLHARSRSRGRSDAGWRDPSPAGVWSGLREHELHMQMQKEREAELIRKNMELKYMREHMERDDADAKAKLEFERRRKDWELERMRDAREREEEEQRIRHEYEMRRKHEEEEEERIRKEFETRRLKEEAKRKREADEAEREKKHAVEEYLREKHERERMAKEAERRALEEHERKEREAKEEEKRLIAKIKMKEAEQEEEEKRQWNEFLLKQKQKQEEEEAKQKKKEAEIQEEMRRRLAEVGFQNNQIDVMIDPRHRHSTALVPGSLPNNPLHVHTPTYVKVHKDHLSVETLRYFDIPWEWDRADKNYIIILRELDQRATEELFEHTRSLHTRTMTHLLVEQKPNRENQYMWVRHKPRRPSVSPKPKSPRKVGFREILM